MAVFNRRDTVSNPLCGLQMQAINVTKGGVTLASDIMCANTSSDRRRGLLGRANLRIDEGIYLTPCEWLHTFGMRFAIDIAFLSAEGEVLAVHRELWPRRLSKIVLRAHGALELAAGALRRSGTEVGDVVQFVNCVTGELVSW